MNQVQTFRTSRVMPWWRRVLRRSTSYDWYEQFQTFGLRYCANDRNRPLVHRERIRKNLTREDCMIHLSSWSSRFVTYSPFLASTSLDHIQYQERWLFLSGWRRWIVAFNDYVRRPYHDGLTFATLALCFLYASNAISNREKSACWEQGGRMRRWKKRVAAL